jgi:hypothetical protein
VRTKVLIWKVADVAKLSPGERVGVPGSVQAVAEAEMVIAIDDGGGARCLKSRYLPPELVEVEVIKR